MRTRKSDFARIADEANEARAAAMLQEKANRGPWSKIGHFFGDVFDWFDEFGEAIAYSFAAVAAIASAGFVGYGFLGLMSIDVSDRETFSSSEAAGSSVELDPAPPVGSPPSAVGLDLSGVWPVLGLIAAGLGLIALGAGTFWVLKRSRQSSLALKREQAAAEEDRRRALAVWQKFSDRHGVLKAKALEIETDWDLLFSYPALLDASVPQTREFHRALKDLDSASNEPPAGINLSMEISGLPYPKLVKETDDAWTAAWSFAQRTGLKLIPRSERKKLDQIERLLKLARSGGSEHERSVAYERVAKLIGELQFVKVPEAALKSIDSHRRAMIEAPTGAATETVNRQSERVFAV